MSATITYVTFKPTARKVVNKIKQLSEKVSFTLSLSLFFSFLFLTFSSINWRVDPHHDGYIFFPAYIGTFGKLPPQVDTAYGIAQPLIESHFMRIFGTSLLTYRSIAAILISASGILLFMILATRISRSNSVLMSCLWLAANPNWSGASKSIPQAIQVSWPNLWIQTLTLVCVYFVLKDRKLRYYEILLVLIISCSLPFFRIQGIIPGFIVILFLFKLHIKPERIISSLFVIFLNVLFWISLIEMNGGVRLYLSNILTEPIAKMEKYTQKSIVIDWIVGVGNYFMVVGLGLLVLYYIFNFRFRKSYSFTRYIILFFMLISASNFIRKPELWISVFTNHITTLLLDSTILIAVMYLVKFCFEYKVEQFKKAKNYFPNLFTAILALSNLIFIYPLPDLGHRWWSSAFCIVFLIFCIESEQEEGTSFRKVIISPLLTVLTILTLLISLFQGSEFLKIKTYKVQQTEKYFLNGMRYPIDSQEAMINLRKSVKLLEKIESKNIEIKFFCRDGLYYIRDTYKSDYYLKSLKFIDLKLFDNTLEGEYVSFFCNLGLEELAGRSYSGKYEIGTDRVDTFIFHNMSEEQIQYLLADLKESP